MVSLKTLWVFTAGRVAAHLRGEGGDAPLPRWSFNRSLVSETTRAITACLDSPDEGHDQTPPTLPGWAVAKLASRSAKSRSTGKFLDTEPMCSPEKLSRAAALTTAAIKTSGGIPKLQLPSERGPILLFAVQTVAAEHLTSNFVANTYCGVHRVGLAAQTFVLALDREAEQVAKSFGLHAVYDEAFLSVLDAVLDVSTIRVAGRAYMARLFGSLAIMEQGRDVLYADIDTFWLQNPFPYLEGLGVDFVASRDMCWSDVNSGFMFMRSAENTKRFLLTSLGYVFEPDHDHDKDQTSVNCALQHMLNHDDLTYAFSDDRLMFGATGFCQFTTGCKGGVTVHRARGTERMGFLDPKTPSILVWHTSSASRWGYFQREDPQPGDQSRMFLSLAMLGMNNFNEAGRCLPRRSEAEVAAVSRRIRRGCQGTFLPWCRDQLAKPTVGDLRLAEQAVELWFGTAVHKENSLRITLSWLARIDSRFSPPNGKESLSALLARSLVQCLHDAAETEDTDLRIALERLPPSSSCWAGVGQKEHKS